MSLKFRDPEGNEQTIAGTPYDTLKEFGDKLNAIQVRSTEERVVGTWVNGKPIYEKVYSVDNLIATTTSYSIADLNIDEVVECSLLSKWHSTGSPIYYFPSNVTVTSPATEGRTLNYTRVYIDTNVNKRIYFEKYESSISSGFNLVMRYTKTTD